MRKSLFILLTLLALAWPAAAWKWPIPKEKFQAMNTFQRAQYQKAAALLESGEFRTAAAEFEKFTVNFEDAPVLPYIIFLRAYSLHQGKDRHKAIEAYNKVLDFFGEDVEAAAPALYFLGRAHLDNGDVKKGMLAMKEMVEDQDYRQHPLAAGALASLADNYWKNQDTAKAIGYWQQIVRDFAKSNPGEAREAAVRLTSYYLKNEKFRDYESWYLQAPAGNGNDQDPKAKQLLGAVSNAFKTAWDLSPNWFTSFQQKERDQCLGAFWTYFKSKKAVYEKADELWFYYANAVLFLARRHPDNEELKKVVVDALQYLAAQKDKSKNDEKYVALCASLREGGQFDLASHVIAKMNDRLLAAWEEYYVLRDRSEWPAALTKLADIEKSGADKDKIAAQWQQGWIYKDRLRQYEKAIKVFQALAQPPRNLWEIQECYFRMGKIKETMQVLGEIEGSFPNDAPNAAFRRAWCYKEAKQNKNAVAAARTVLKKYPKSQAASQAHQLLEEFGVATGGGVADGD